MRSQYRTIRTINRTYRRPVRVALPIGLYDLQALPPYGWCSRCGKEIYKKEHNYCPKCATKLKVKN